ncbi:hypothetical protein [Pseudoxanthomonas wuyuanensis]|uniref:Uncharacterized protein n=1 Tax=Pseudoxanthomonas wuyuanensis TaxID=1073196 RepID=A0A286DDU9_9GAMM|nr:hypothetical protein [Pseudoxanthomonas wuyuanensis]KAF1719993.1 hypothetical protein CSC75_12665 [Pseudoxanthomonas wuyuanensis]SOD56838.1 hypothetical protein SAMN06296416_11134 [Pseudoxanthomonas wuyuanensis]
MLRILAAALASAFVLPVSAIAAGLLLGGYDAMATGSLLGLAVLLVVVPHVLLLGVPAFLLLRHLRRLGGWTMALAGLVAGMLPAGLYSWPYWRRHPGYTFDRDWHGNAVTVVRDGVPTLHGVLMHLESMFIFGLLGVVCALVFWFCWLHLQRRAGLPVYPGDARSPSGPQRP